MSDTVYKAYKLIHLSGIFMIFLALGGMILSAAAKEATASLKNALNMLHGIGLGIVIIAGFGMLAKTHAAFEGWVVVKLLVWVFFGGSIAIIRRKPDMGKMMLWLCVALGIVAVYMALFQPF